MFHTQLAKLTVLLQATFAANFECKKVFLPKKKVTNMRYNQISHPFVPSGGNRTGSLYFTREKDVSTLAGSVDILSEQI